MRNTVNIAHDRLQPSIPGDLDTDEIAARAADQSFGKNAIVLTTNGSVLLAGDFDGDIGSRPRRVEVWS